MTDGPLLKPPPPEPRVPWVFRASWRIYDLVTWPWAVREFKRAGFRRTGWMQWESGPAGEEPDG
jgi:hypothetical protein